MANVDFGETVDFTDFLLNLVNTVPQTATTSGRLLLLHHYETAYGIYNHDADTNPDSLAIVRMHPSEDTYTGSRLAERTKQFAEREVAKFFNISLLEFLELPSYYCLDLLKISREMQAKAAQAAANVMNSVGNLKDG